MVNNLIFLIPGEPQGKERPRFVRGRSVRTYTPASTHRYEDLVRYYSRLARSQHYIDKPVSQECGVSIKAYFGVPKSYSKKRRELCLSGKEHPAKKPDGDNIAKIILDGLNPKMKLDKVQHKRVCLAEGFYEDDKQVVNLSVEKFYSDKPHVEVRICWED